MTVPLLSPTTKNGAPRAKALGCKNFAYNWELPTYSEAFWLTVEKRPTSYSDSELRIPKFLEKTTKNSSPGPDPE